MQPEGQGVRYRDYLRLPPADGMAQLHANFRKITEGGINLKASYNLKKAIPGHAN